MTYRQSYKVTAPVARSTAYDFNAQLSKSHQRIKNYLTGAQSTAVDCSDDQDRDVMPHEILFELKSKLLVSNARIHGSSSVNGVKLGLDCCGAVQAQLVRDGCSPQHAAAFTEPIVQNHPACLALKNFLEANTTARSKASDVLTSYFTYIGVAVTPCKSGPAGGALQRQGFSASRGGLMTIINTGEAALRPGDRVRMVIDVLDVVRGRRGTSHTITGIPKTKIVARLVHVPVRDARFEDVADGITSREMVLQLDEPGVLSPRLEYVARERYPWSMAAYAPDVGAVAAFVAQETALLGTFPPADRALAGLMAASTQAAYIAIGGAGAIRGQPLPHTLACLANRP